MRGKLFGLWMVLRLLLLPAITVGDDYRQHIPPAKPKSSVAGGISTSPQGASASAAAELSPVAMPERKPVRPVLFFYTTPNCSPCVPIKVRVKAGELSDFDVQECEPPEWIGRLGLAIPMFQFDAQDGTPRRFHAWEYSADRLLPELRKAWHKHNPGALLASEVVAPLAPGASLGPQPPSQPVAQKAQPKPAGASPVEQARKFLTDSGKFTLIPSKPVKATLDDGTVVDYTRISGSWKIDAQGVPTITLEQPLPQVHVQRLGFWFGALVQGGSGNLSTVPPTVTVETSRGKYTVKLEEAR